MTEFEYSNISDRPPGRLLSTAAKFSRGVRSVQEDVEPFARDWERHNRGAVAAAGPLWVVCGDSMAQGVGATTFDRGWVGQLAATLPYRLVNLSTFGARITDVTEKQLPAMATIGAHPDLVTVVIGSNDLVNKEARENIAANLSAMLEALPPGSYVGSQPGSRSSVNEFNRTLDDEAERLGHHIIEFRDPRMRSWRGKLAADHFHPNDAGYAGMAAIVAEALTTSATESGG